MNDQAVPRSARLRYRAPKPQLVSFLWLIFKRACFCTSAWLTSHWLLRAQDPLLVELVQILTGHLLSYA